MQRLNAFLQDSTPLGLSRQSLIAAHKPIFFLDSLTALTVYYSAEATHLPFPPPKGSSLRRTIDGIRQQRQPTSALRLLMGGVDDIKPFLALLLEDPEVDEIGKVITPSYTDFIEKIKMRVWQFLESRKGRSWRLIGSLFTGTLKAACTWEKPRNTAS